MTLDICWAAINPLFECKRAESFRICQIKCQQIDSVLIDCHQFNALYLRQRQQLLPATGLTLLSKVFVYWNWFVRVSVCSCLLLCFRFDHYRFIHLSLLLISYFCFDSRFCFEDLIYLKWLLRAYRFSKCHLSFLFVSVCYYQR